MQQKSKVNWWAILAVVIIGVPLGFIGNKLMHKPGPLPDTIDTIEPIIPTPIPEPVPEQPYLTVGRNQISFTADGGKETLKIESNTQWKVVTAEDGGWLSAASMSGEGSGTVKLSAKANTATKARTTTVAIQWTDNRGDAQTQSITVNQAEAKKIDEPNPVPPAPKPDPQPDPVPSKPSLSVAPSSLSFPTSGGSKTITVKSNMTWSIKANGGDGWLTLSTTEGRATAKVTLRATSNTATEPRTATVEVTGTDDDGNTIRKTISITQAKAEPLPARLTNEQVQWLIDNGKTTHKMLSSSCSVVVNKGKPIAYSTFLAQRKSYSAITVSSAEYSDSDNKVTRIYVVAEQKHVAAETKTQPNPKPVPTPVKVMTKEDVLSLLNSGKRSDSISGDCTIELKQSDGKTHTFNDYSDYLNGKSLKAVSISNVESFRQDTKGKVVHIVIKGRMNSNYEE